MMDGPAGIRGSDFVSAFPAASHLGATWDKQLMYDYGKAMGEEYHDKGIHMMLGPQAGALGRVVKGGRNWEGPGSDPYLAGVQMGELVNGAQDGGVIACSKVCHI